MDIRIKFFSYLADWFYSVFIKYCVHLSVNVFHALPPVFIYLLPSLLVRESHIETVHHAQKASQNSLAHRFRKHSLAVILPLLIIGKFRPLLLPASQIFFFFFLGNF